MDAQIMIDQLNTACDLPEIDLTEAEQVRMGIEATRIEMDGDLTDRVIFIVDRLADKLNLSIESLASKGKLELLGYAIDLVGMSK